jgi:hypothetical protein
VAKYFENNYNKNTALLFVDNQVITRSEDRLQKGIFESFKITGECNMEISTAKIKVLAFQGKFTNKRQNCVE